MTKAKYILSKETRNKNTKKNLDYLITYFICAYVLNLALMICIWIFTDKLFDYKFASYGYDFFSYYMTSHNQDLINPCEEVFPKMTNCLYRRFGHSGTITNSTALCTIPLNILNEKIFALLWLLYVFETFILGLTFILSIFLLCPSVRCKYYRWTLDLTHENAAILNREFKLADWFLLAQMSKNVDRSVFEFIVESYCLGQKWCEKDEECGTIHFENLARGLKSGRKEMLHDAKKRMKIPAIGHMELTEKKIQQQQQALL